MNNSTQILYQDTIPWIYEDKYKKSKLIRILLWYKTNLEIVKKSYKNFVKYELNISYSRNKLFSKINWTSYEELKKEWRSISLKSDDIFSYENVAYAITHEQIEMFEKLLEEYISKYKQSKKDISIFKSLFDLSKWFLCTYHYHNLSKNECYNLILTWDYKKAYNLAHNAYKRYVNIDDVDDKDFERCKYTWLVMSTHFEIILQSLYKWKISSDHTSLLWRYISWLYLQLEPNLVRELAKYCPFERLPVINPNKVAEGLYNNGYDLLFTKQNLAYKWGGVSKLEDTEYNIPHFLTFQSFLLNYKNLDEKEFENHLKNLFSYRIWVDSQEEVKQFSQTLLEDFPFLSIYQKYFWSRKYFHRDLLSCKSNEIYTEFSGYFKNEKLDVSY